MPITQLHGKSSGLLLLALFFLFPQSWARAVDLPAARAISYPLAREWARQAQENSTFPIVVNEQVLRALNEIASSKSARFTMRKAIAAMQAYREPFENIMRENDLPLELLALPIVESGYRNLPSSASPYRTAGLWQFIKGTARTYGLRVTKERDERLNAILSTRAAARFLKDLFLQFHDWSLVLAAYNQGAGRVEEWLDESSGANAWFLAKKHGGAPYLTRVMVAMIVLNNPSVLD